MRAPFALLFDWFLNNVVTNKFQIELDSFVTSFLYG